jgi:hypothetical protein
MLINEQEILQKLLEKPYNYKMLLKDGYGRNTQTIILRKRMLRLIKEGRVQRVHLSGSRGKGILFINKDKKYNIVVSMQHRDFKYYYCDVIQDLERMIVLLKNTYELIDDEWKKIGDCELFIGNIIKKL